MNYLQLFTEEYVNRSPVTGISIPRDINYLRRLYDFNFKQIENYYQNRNFSVKNTNILSRVIEHIAPHLGYDIYRYLEYIENKLIYIGKHFKFTSDIEKGIVHFEQFFSESEEVIIITNDTLNVKHIEKNWKTYPCIHVLKHARNDLKLLLPLGKDDGGRSGLTVLELDLRVLAIKYREFIREQLQNENIQLNKNHFVIKYVLNVTIPSITDHILLNRVMHKFYGVEQVIPRYKHPFKIFEPTQQVDRYVENTLDIITSKKLDFINMLHNIQLVNKMSASELLILPDMASTRQSTWSLFISRLDHMLFLFDACKDNTINRTIINDWKRLAERILRDNVLENKFSYTEEKSIKEKTLRLKEL